MKKKTNEKNEETGDMRDNADIQNVEQKVEP